jgi:hypothetical protein
MTIEQKIDRIARVLDGLPEQVQSDMLSELESRISGLKSSCMSQAQL